MKKLVKLLVSLFVLLFAVANTYSQSISRVIDIHEKQDVLVKLNYAKNTLMAFKVIKNDKGSIILPVFDGTQFDKVRIELYDGEKLLTKYIDDKKSGPSLGFEDIVLYESGIPLFSSINSKVDAWPIYVAAVILCCVEVEVNYSEKDGWSGSVRFDCDCIKVELKPSQTKTNSSNKKLVVVKGKKYYVTEIKIIPLNQDHLPKNVNKKEMSISVENI